jgi:hypothetical protein
MTTHVTNRSGNAKTPIVHENEPVVHRAGKVTASPDPGLEKHLYLYYIGWVYTGFFNRISR